MTSTKNWTNKHARMASLAYHESTKSPMFFRHGCVIAKGRKVVSHGFNNSRIKCKEGLISDTSCSCHAEVDAIRRVYGSRLRKVGPRRTAKVA